MADAVTAVQTAPYVVTYVDSWGNTLGTATRQRDGEDWFVFRSAWADGMSYLRAVDVTSLTTALHLARAIRAEMTAHGL